MMDPGLTFRVPGKNGLQMYHLEINHANPLVLCGGSAERIRMVAEYLDQSTSNPTQIIESQRGLVTVHGQYKGVPITAFSTGMGTPSVSATLPEIIEACPEKKMTIIRLGTAGALQRDIQIGDYVITTKAIPTASEAVGRYLMGADYQAAADPEVIEVLEKLARKKAFVFQGVYAAPTEVTGDLYVNNISAPFLDHGEAVAMSMEFTAISALRDLYNQTRINPKLPLEVREKIKALSKKEIKAGCLLLVVDSQFPEGHHWEKKFRTKQAEIERRQIKAGLEALVSMKEK